MVERDTVRIAIAELSKRFHFVGSYSENAFSIEHDGKWFHVDINGNRLYERSFEKVGPFQNGVAWVRRGNRAIQISKDGLEVTSA